MLIVQIDIVANIMHMEGFNKAPTTHSLITVVYKQTIKFK